VADILSALRVVIGADTAALTRGLKDAESKVSSFGTGIAGTAKLITAAFAGLATAISAGLKMTINDADKMGKMAQSIGIPVEELSKLNFAADLAGVSLDDLGKSMARLSRNMNDFASGAKGPAANAFRTLEISVKNADGSLKDTSVLFSEIAEKFAGMKDGAGKTALAIALFGRAGASLIPLLNAGASGLKIMKNEAERLGLVITQEAYLGAERFNDALTRLKGAAGGVLIQLLGTLGSSLAAVSSHMEGLSASGKQLGPLIEGLANIVRVLATAVLANATAFITAIHVWTGAVKALYELGKLNPSKALDELTAGAQRGKNALMEFGAVVKGIWGLMTPPSGMDLEFRIPAFFDKVKKDAPAFGKAIDSAKGKVSELHAELRKLEEELRTPSEEYAHKLERLDYLFKETSLSAENYARAVSKAQAEMAKASPTLQVLEQGLTSAFDRALDGAMTFQEQLQALGRDLARLAAQAAFKALLFPSTTGPGLIGSLFAPRAAGGPVSAGQSYLIGERGPELFTPAASGRISSNRDLMGGGGSLTVHVVSDDDKFRAFVQDESGKVVAQSSPAIVAKATQTSVRAVRSGRNNDPSFLGR